MGRKTLPPPAAKKLYDRIGSLQETQSFYENPATDELLEHSRLGDATAIVEFGCGTGALAERMIRKRLPGHAIYQGVDVSSTMVGLASDRLRRWADRTKVSLSDGSPCVDAPDGTFDRFLSTYVFDLLSEEDMRALVAEAHRVLKPSGLACIASATRGESLASKLVMGAMDRVHSLDPRLVGGCRPVHLAPLFAAPDWNLVHRGVVSVFGITSEIVVAERR
jgi:ubiquinone/menaquinone biosynthesis C-methylase UbiE